MGYIMSIIKQDKLKWGLFFLLCFGLLFAVTLLLSQEQQSLPDKIDFPLQTITPLELWADISFEKAGKIVAAQDILVAAQVNWKVERIAFKEGDEVKGGNQVVFLADTIADYKLQTQRAKNNLDRALLMKEQNENNLQQQLNQAQNAYQTAQQAFEFAQTQAQNALKKADLGILSAQGQIENLKNQFQNQKNILINQLTSIIDAADKRLGLTPFFEDQQTGFEIYIGAKDPLQKTQTKEALKNLDTTRAEIRNLSSVPANPEQLFSSTQQLDRAYSQIEQFAAMMVALMKNSIPSEGTLSQATINANIDLYQSYQSGPLMLGAKSGFIAYASQVDAQLLWSGTLVQDGASLDYDNTLAGTKNSLFNAEIALKNAKINYETIMANHQLQLGLLDNAISEAKIAYEMALTQYAKLIVRSPVSGVIGEILITEWQNLAQWTPVFKVATKHQQQIEVYITANEYRYIQQDQPVYIDYQSKNLTGVIESISTVADQSNLFKVTIQLQEKLDLLWDIAKVTFPISVDTQQLLPLSIVKILWENKGVISIFTGGEIQEFPIMIKSIWGEYIELEQALPLATKIIVTDLHSFDQNKHQPRE